MQADPAIRISGLTKRFRKRRVGSGYTTLKTQLVALFAPKRHERLEERVVHILDGIDLEVPRGSTLALIGRNGSGKSTLLKILAGIYSATSGTIQMEGRVAALLELGAGFHPEFSGRENIFISGVILGVTRAQIRARMDEIIAFSELEPFIDQPVRTYSSGMYTRLAFAVASHVDPDILLIDEILAVGDEHFSRKSLAKMEEFKRQGKTIVLVTHDLGVVERWCDRAAWLEQGQVALVGEPRSVVDAYRQRLAGEEVAPQGPAVGEGAPSPGSALLEGDGSRPSKIAPADERWGNEAVRITGARLVDGKDEETTVFRPESALTLEVTFEANEGIEDFAFGFGVFDEQDRQLFGTNTAIEGTPLPSPLPCSGRVRVAIDRLGLNEGNYRVDVAAHAVDGLAYDYRRKLLRFAVRRRLADAGAVRLFHTWKLLPPTDDPPPDRGAREPTTS